MRCSKKVPGGPSSSFARTFPRIIVRVKKSKQKEIWLRINVKHMQDYVRCRSKTSGLIGKGRHILKVL